VIATLELVGVGELDGDVEGDRVWVMCTCGAVISRRADDD